MGERRGRIQPADTARFLTLLERLPVDLDVQPSVFTSVLPLARGYALTAYDAAYLELAMRLRLPLATLDDRLRDAATRGGVLLLQAD